MSDSRTSSFPYFPSSSSVPRSSIGVTATRVALNMSWTTHFLNLYDRYTHLLRTSPTRSIHLHVLDNSIISNPDNVHHILKTKFYNNPKGTPFSILQQAI
ncbi:hypothetical protein AHAS_Ahas06G0078800 [Arachis hypogaea]